MHRSPLHTQAVLEDGLHAVERQLEMERDTAATLRRREGESQANCDLLQSHLESLTSSARTTLTQKSKEIEGLNSHCAALQEQLGSAGATVHTLTRRIEELQSQVYALRSSSSSSHGGPSTTANEEAARDREAGSSVSYDSLQSLVAQLQKDKSILEVERDNAARELSLFQSIREHEQQQHQQQLQQKAVMLSVRNVDAWTEMDLETIQPDHLLREDIMCSSSVSAAPSPAAPSPAAAAAGTARTPRGGAANDELVLCMQAAISQLRGLLQAQEECLSSSIGSSVGSRHGNHEDDGRTVQEQLGELVAELCSSVSHMRADASLQVLSPLSLSLSLSLSLPLCLPSTNTPHRLPP